MKRILMGLILCTVSLAMAQQWEIQSPLPTSGDLNTACFVDATTGFVGSNNATIFRTADGGQTWAMVNTGTIEHWIESICFTDQLNGWAGGPNNTLFHTIDGGLTWQPATTGVGFQVNDIFFTSATNGWIFGSPTFHTIDGGLTWEIPAGMNNNTVVYHSFFLDSLNGWYESGWPRNLHHTQDGGITWSFYELDRAQGIQDLFFISPSEGWMTTAESDEETYYVGRILHTVDGGDTWTEQIVDSTMSFSSICFRDPLRGCVTTERGVLTTEDGGLTWQNRTGLDVTMSHLCRLPQGFCALGEGSLILRSDDNGMNWQQICHGTSSGSWEIMAFADLRHGWVGGARGRVLRTTDGGGQWWVSSLPDRDMIITALSAPDSSTIIAATTNGKINRSEDGGLTWASEIPFDINPVTSMSFPDALHGWAITLDSIYHTEDGGRSWTAQAPIDNCSEIFFYDTLSGWACGSQQWMKHTNDGGETWHTQWTSAGAGISDLVFTDLNTGWGVTGFQASLVHTVDGGLNWTLFTLPQWYWIQSMTWTDSLNGYIIGGLSGVQHSDLVETHDGGVTWSVSEAALPVNSYASSMVFPTSTEGWVLDGGSILHYTATPPNRVHDTFILHPSSFDLSCYPNPFNPTSTISFTLPKAGMVKMGVYDVMGRLTKSALPCGTTGVLSAGEHHYTFNGSALPSGTYFVKLEAANAVQVKKVLLLK